MKVSASSARRIRTMLQKTHTHSILKDHYQASPLSGNGRDWRTLHPFWGWRRTGRSQWPSAHGGCGGRAISTSGSRWRGAGPCDGTPGAARPVTWAGRERGELRAQSCAQVFAGEYTQRGAGGGLPLTLQTAEIRRRSMPWYLKYILWNSSAQFWRSQWALHFKLVLCKARFACNVLIVIEFGGCNSNNAQRFPYWLHI